MKSTARGENNEPKKVTETMLSNAHNLPQGAPIGEERSSENSAAVSGIFGDVSVDICSGLF